MASFIVNEAETYEFYPCERAYSRKARAPVFRRDSFTVTASDGARYLALGNREGVQALYGGTGNGWRRMKDDEWPELVVKAVEKVRSGTQRVTVT